jgi:hypothetical protein
MSECIHGALYAIELFCEMNMDENTPKLVRNIFISLILDKNNDRIY